MSVRPADRDEHRFRHEDFTPAYLPLLASGELDERARDRRRL